MSEIKRISPLLDNYDIGGSISEHAGVVCYPAMRVNTDEKYIVKTVSIPASQTQLDALLLTGAFSDATEALSYFKDQADSTAQEIEILNQLSQLEGFLPFEDYQIASMDDRIGFDIYMISSYRKSLRKYLQRQPMTHLGAVNLGLDICAALAACRHQGYLYVDLKPNNIYLIDDHKYRIGDIGFLPLKALSYASIPDRCRSEYTAPEVQDAFAMLNSTIDIYALGLILYQVYNGGLLPSENDLSEGFFPAPANADYEMAEIILKACAADPDARWQDPIEMGQALISYMQRNGVNDTPIVPPVIPTVETKDIDLSDVSLTESPEAEEINELPDLPSVDGIQEETPIEAHEINDTEQISIEDLPMQADVEENAEAVVEEVADNTEIPTETEPSVRDEAVESPTEAAPAEDETSPEHNISDVDYEEVSDELNEILAQADELVAHPVPEPVIAPEPIEIQLPAPEEPIPDDLADTAEDETDVQNEADLAETVVIPVKSQDQQDSVPANNETPETDAEEAAPVTKKRSAMTWILNSILILLILAIIAVGFFYYKNIYLLPINEMTVDGDETSMVVYMQSDIDESLLSVVCSDSHGNQISAPVVDGMATFANLAPDTVYNIQILVDGFHRLTGETSVSYSTPPQTNVVQFLAVTGTEDGSVILQFTDDPTSDCSWHLTYSAEGEEEQTVEMLSHFITLTGLTIGKEYTFKLTPAEDMYVTGQTEIKFTPSKLVFAEDVAVVSCVNNQLVVSWVPPVGVAVSEWTVRCYNDNIDYNETTITADTTATFQIADPDKSYFVDVTAAGMSVGKTAYMPENAITVTDFAVDSASGKRMTLNWQTDQGIPENGWLLMYTIENTGIQTSVVCTENSAVISPVIPGATYSFSLQQSNGDAVLTYPLTYTTAKPQDFSGYGMIRSSMTYKLCKRPTNENWKHDDISSSDYTKSFKVGEGISIVGQLHDTYGISDDNIVTMYVFRDADSKVVCYSYTESTWNDMWSKSYGEFDVPVAPTTAGEYTMSIYFNGKLVANKAVTIE